MSMYIRVKRKKTTVFLQVEPTDTVLEVKQKLQALVEWPPHKLQLFKEPHNQPTVLEDAKKLADLRVENDEVVAMAYLQDGRLRHKTLWLISAVSNAKGHDDAPLAQPASTK
eukprot:GHRR01031067.1.p1 GENE.GHRR01031067.1~~GHRR01031067.1.p1  ORF type:complete len:112 (+),score=28.86 GHRR01031067.1:293-628(+)